ncbi:hypothetical protein [Bdellovibrio sp. HCB337]|uniref:hypothetical protein n=1 Tax=Bdellovibrio sp. HCB337 TaxID=3394358 RepID=UPI0039A62781
MKAFILGIKLLLTSSSVYAADAMISGETSYLPGAKVPSQTVCAIPYDGTKSEICTVTETTNYRLNLMPGKYYVYATLLNPNAAWNVPHKAYFSEFVACGSDSKKCQSHVPLIVDLDPNEHKINIDPQDWQSPHADSRNMAISYTKEKLPVCSIKGKYFVVLSNKNQKAGYFMDFYEAKNQDISYKSCNKVEYGKPLFQLQEEGIFLLNVKGDLVFVDSGTNNEIRTLRIYNLKEKKQAFKTEYSTLKFVNETILELGIQEKYIKNSCSKESLARFEIKKMKPATERKQILDTKTLKLTKTDEISCTSPDDDYDY